MKAMIFAAGLGTRLKPLTNTMPKALVPVGNKPLLQHAIEKLKVAGFDEIVINVHHFAQQIIDFVEANQQFGIRIVFSDEQEKLLDTGGGIKKASCFFDDGQPFLVHNVDILSNIDLKKLYKTHILQDSHKMQHLALPVEQESNHRNTTSTPIATLVCSERKTSRYLLFDHENLLKGWINESTGEVKSPIEQFNPLLYKKLAFSGIQILHPDIFQYMSTFPTEFSIIDFYLSICNKEKIVANIPENSRLIDVGKLASLEEAEKFKA